MSMPAITASETQWNLRDFQRDAISAVMESRDTVVRVPTGSGKSLIFWVSHVAW